MADDHGPENLVAGRDPHAVFATVGQSDNARPRHAFRCVDFAGRDLLVPHAFAARERPRILANRISEPTTATIKNPRRARWVAVVALAAALAAGVAGSRLGDMAQALAFMGSGAYCSWHSWRSFRAASQRCILVVRDDGPRGDGRACL